jgi:hypothetical protein
MPIFITDAALSFSPIFSRIFKHKPFH